MKKYLLIIIALIAGAASVWSQSVAVEADFSIVFGDGNTSTETEKMTIYGYGYGDLANIKMSQNMAQLNSREMLAKQASGNKFAYTRENGISEFKLNTNADLQGVTAVSMDSPDGKHVLIVSSAEVEAEKPVGEDVFSVSMDFSMDDGDAETGYLSEYLKDGLAAMRRNRGNWSYVVNNLLNGMMYEAVKQAVNERALAGETVEGTVYITNLSISF